MEEKHLTYNTAQIDLHQAPNWKKKDHINAKLFKIGTKQLVTKVHVLIKEI